MNRERERERDGLIKICVGNMEYLLLSHYWQQNRSYSLLFKNKIKKTPISFYLILGGDNWYIVRSNHSRRSYVLRRSRK